MDNVSRNKKVEAIRHLEGGEMTDEHKHSEVGHFFKTVWNIKRMQLFLMTTN